MTINIIGIRFIYNVSCAECALQVCRKWICYKCETQGYKIRNILSKFAFVSAYRVVL